MNYPLDPIRLSRKKSVIEYIDYIIDCKSQEEYSKKKDAVDYFIVWLRNKVFTKNYRRTFPPAKTYTDFLQAIEGSKSEITEMDGHIDRILISSGSDKIVLEECENYLNRKYKTHLAKMPLSINALSFVTLFGTVMILVLLIRYFPSTNLKSNDIDAKIIGFLTSTLISLAASTTISNTLVTFLRCFIEYGYSDSISTYEYCIELVKDAKLRIV